MKSFLREAFCILAANKYLFKVRKHMRILIFALPRTGSKFVCGNVVRYIGDRSYRHLDIFYGEDKHKLLAIEDGKITPTEIPVIHTSKEFFKNRIDMIRRTPGTLVVKCHQEKIYQYPELMKELIEQFDHVILVERRDVFNQLLSEALAIKFTAYVPGAKLNKRKMMLRANPTSIDIDWWSMMINDYKEFRKIDFGIDLTRVQVEDLFNADDEEFCKLLNLPTKKFTMFRNTEEFGNKSKFVENYDELQAVFNELIKDTK
jgi:hypothetical protein